METTTLVIGSSKGGVGKSTLCVNLAAELAARGESCAIIDADPNQPLTMWRDQITQDGEMPDNMSVITFSGGKQSIEDLIQQQQGSCRNLIVDLAGFADMTVAQAALECDFFLLPFRPAVIDLNVSQSVTRYLRKVHVPYAAIATQTQAAVRATSEVTTKAALVHMGVPVFESEFIMRNAFKLALNEATTLPLYEKALRQMVSGTGISSTDRQRARNGIDAIQKARQNLQAILGELIEFMNAANTAAA